mgnify:FL=1
MYKALLVEQQHICRTMEDLVDWEALGFDSVICAESFPEALDKAVSLEPQIAIIGMTLGDRMGYELAERFREMGLKTVCCLLTAHFDLHDARRAMRSGCRDFLRWPLEALKLKEFLDWAVATELQGPMGKNRRKEEKDLVLDVDPANFSKVTHKILQAVRKDYWHSLSLTSIAKQQKMSSKYMGRVFLKETGMRFTDYLLAYRMLEAKRMILTSGEKISVVAASVGYTQLNNFYTHFHQYFGVSPSLLRNAHVNEESIV